MNSLIDVLRGMKILSIHALMLGIILSIVAKESKSVLKGLDQTDQLINPFGIIPKRETEVPPTRSVSSNDDNQPLITCYVILIKKSNSITSEK
ncbi:hypothetical protein A9Q98_01340 [Thalassotalea sp. 42_200_T64]|nr:hypothetical protein A9Q98_01340 [Thalassotalea sp. 42_200_T64]